MIEEEWREIDGFPEYAVSSLGRVYSKHINAYLKPSDHKDGYLQLRLVGADGVRSSVLIHRLVGLTFLPHSIDEIEINHLDGDKRNNAVYNLEWTTPSNNVIHAYRTGLREPSGGRPKHPLIIVETQEKFESASACARAIDGNFSAIAACLRGDIPSYRGLHFETIPFWEG